jgi:hypothetical protein
MPKRFFTTAEATYEILRQSLNAQLGYPNAVAKSIFHTPLQAPRDSFRRVLLAVDTDIEGYGTIDAALSLLLSGDAAEELDEATYLASLSGALTAADIGAAALPTTGLRITKSGDWSLQTPTPLFNLVPAQAYQLGDTFTRYTGKWIFAINYSETLWVAGQPRITALTFEDLEGIQNSITQLQASALTTLSFPALRVVGGSFFGASGTTLPALTTLSLPNLTIINGSLAAVIFSLTALPALSMPSLTYLGGSFNLSGMNALTTLSFPNLSFIASSFNPQSSSILTAISFPNLSYIGSSFQPNSLASLTSISMPNLTYIGGALNPSGVGSLPTLSMPALNFIGGNITLSSGVGSFTTLSLPALTYLGNSTGTSLNLNLTTALTTISLPSLITISGGAVNMGGAAVANVTFPTDGRFKNGGLAFNCTNAALTQASVNNILQAYASLDGTNGTTSWVQVLNVSGGTSAAPSNLGSTTTPGSQFVCAGTTCTVNWTAHGYATGDVLRISGITTATNANRYAVITVVNANQFTYAITSQTATGAGTATVVRAGLSARALVTRGVTLTTN